MSTKAEKLVEVLKGYDKCISKIDVTSYGDIQISYKANKPIWSVDSLYRSSLDFACIDTDNLELTFLLFERNMDDVIESLKLDI